MKKPALKLLTLSLCLTGFMSPLQAVAAQPTQPEVPLIDLASELEGMKGETGNSPKPTPVAQPSTAVNPPSKTPAVSKAPSTKAKPQEHAVHWGYSGNEGPSHWGDLSPKNLSCKEGKNQSPINLKDKTAVSTTGLGGLDIYYRDVPLKVINNGHTVQVNYPLGSYIKVGGDRYELLQFHFHTPSEHQKDGFNYPMEAHLVHKDGEGNLAVLGIIFQEGEENPALNILLSNLPKKVGKLEIHRRASLNPARFLPGNTEFYKYSGSLTTPPCSEGVYWMVFKQPIDVSAEQIQKMNELMGDNARPVQPNYARSLLKSWSEPLQEQESQLYEFY